MEEQANPGSPPAPERAVRRPVRERGWLRTFESLSNRQFLLLWLGMIGWMCGMNMQFVARGYLVYDMTDSASLLGVVNVGSAITTLSLALYGGALADRLERKLIIQASQLVSILTALFIGLAITTDVITWHYLLISSAVQGAASAFQMPARQAIIAQIVGPERLTNALALNGAAMSLTILVAPAIAGGLYAVAGPDSVYYLISFLGLISVTFTAFVRRTGISGTRQGAVTSEIREGLSYLRTNRLVFILVLTGVIGTILSEPFWLMVPVFIVDIYNRGPEAMGLLISVVGVGSLIGSMIVAVVGRKRRGALFLVSALLTGLGLLMIGVFPFYFAAVAIMIPLGLGESGRWSLNQALVMEGTEDRFRGRVASIFSLTWGLIPLGALPYGVMIDLVGGRMAVGVLSGMLILFILGVTVLRRDLRTLQ